MGVLLAFLSFLKVILLFGGAGSLLLCSGSLCEEQGLLSAQCVGFSLRWPLVAEPKALGL